MWHDPGGGGGGGLHVICEFRVLEGGQQFSTANSTTSIYSILWPH